MPGDERAKRPLTLLAGPYGHPFHPLAVTVPIGAWVTSFVFDLASRWAGEPEMWAGGARWLIGIGVLGAVGAAVLGLLDLFAIPGRTPASRTAYTHMIINLVIVGLFTASFLIRDGETAASWSLLALSAVALGLLTVSGWLGGKLTYRYGVRVADDATQAEGFRQEGA